MISFFDCDVQVVNHSPEPTLRQIIMHYYTSHGISSDLAKKFTENYIRELVSKLYPVT